MSNICVLFFKIQNTGQKFTSDMEMQSAVRLWLRQRPASSAEGIQKLAYKWDQCLMHLYDMLKQVAQPWQRDRAKLDTTSINVQRYSQNHAQH